MEPVLIDTLMSERKGYTSVYFIGGSEGSVIMDSGVSVTAENIIKSLREKDAGLKSIRYIMLSHAHYDHSGGTKELLRLLRQDGNSSVKAACSKKPQIYLSRADICEKLLHAGKVTEGSLAGELLPIDESDVEVLEDGTEIDLGNVTIKAIDSPGHGKGHMVFQVPEMDFMFVGDACGLLGREKDGTPMIFPTAFAPEYEHEVYCDTVQKIADTGIGRVGFAHFGILENPAPTLERSIEDAGWVRDLCSRLYKEEIDDAETVKQLETKFGTSLNSLYGDRQRAQMTITAIISGMITDIKRSES